MLTELKERAGMCLQVNGAPTWFFPLSINRLVTLPKGTPSETTSASDTSMGTLRTWRTREGIQGDRSPLYFLPSVPLAAKRKKEKERLSFFLLYQFSKCQNWHWCTWIIQKARPVRHQTLLLSIDWHQKGHCYKIFFNVLASQRTFNEG